MRAVQFTRFGEALDVVEVADPSPAPHGVVIEVALTGLCRSDWHGWQGHDDAITTLPHVPGHEFTGRIVEVGEQVQRWRVGDRVAVPFVCACGTCGTCETGAYQVCPHQWQPGFHGWGSFAQFVAVPHADANLVRLPASISDAAATALGCRTATAWRALALIGRLQPGEELVVHGAGGVGLSAVQIARALGARITVVDPDPQARDLAAHLGAAVTIDPGDDRLAESDGLIDAILEATSGGAHVSVDAIGSPEVPRLSILGLRRRGRHVQVGLLPDSAQIPMPRVISWELAVFGAHGLAAHDYPELLALVEQGRVRPEALHTRTIGLGDVPAALAAMGTPDHPAGVTLIQPTAP